MTGNPASVTHTYADGPNNYAISATATDEDGTYAAGNTVAVTVQQCGADAGDQRRGDVNEGATYTLNLSSVRSGRGHDHELDDQLGRRHRRSSPAIRRG